MKIAWTIPLLALSLTAFTGCASDDGEDPGPTDPEAVTIAEARAQEADSEATVEGTVTVAPGIFTSSIGDQGFAIQDDTGGIYVSAPAQLDVELGDKVRIHGSLKQVAQLTTLVADAASLEVLEGTAAITPEDVTTGRIGEDTEGTLVRVSGALTKAIEDDTPYGHKIYIDDGSGEVQIFVHIVDGAPIVSLDGLDMGDEIEVTGLSAQYEATYEVAPRLATDLTVAAAP
ncbi:DNA-binding protein [Chondromyces apiculatus]|uniref:DNA-binding protein n=1 Tax=Chondromyces apiculatus DSM 436 TaxID=1192034 RepID=A0A017T6J9_9BACT|nr:DNA-binding protein [Chondromyces apiculatus]EYF04893.1 Hypothetical protein CAP_3704 [Chondromyces apiculatus DSM 436]